ncbi:MAG: hypothetical protein ACLVML_05245 [Candidatus Gastranaerophilaceae bacterium]|nr:hypothetical protein [Christensenellales bacterium]
MISGALVGRFGAAYAGAGAGVEMLWWIGAIGVGLSAVLVYCDGNNPSLTGKY